MTNSLTNGTDLGLHFLAEQGKDQGMQLTRMGEYAIRAMMHLSAQPFGKKVPISEVSTRWDIPQSFLRKISAHLAKARLIITQRGVGGGLSLARPAEEITLLDVMEAIEGPLSLNKCLINPRVCPRTNWCAVHLLWSEGQEKLKETLRSRSLAELAQLTGLAAGSWEEPPGTVLQLP
jgi:Rrf2 family iron-sulfur cluster assembly transcriptional regulator